MAISTQPNRHYIKLNLHNKFTFIKIIPFDTMKNNEGLDEEFKYTLHKKVFNLADAEVLDLQNIKGNI